VEAKILAILPFANNAGTSWSCFVRPAKRRLVEREVLQEVRDQPKRHLDWPGSDCYGVILWSIGPRAGDKTGSGQWS
jgi:hypothetical protein